MTYIIELEELVKYFANEKALNGIDLHVKRGEIFGLLGPSGSGKTTTIKILTGQLKPTQGSVKVFGNPFSKLQQSDYRRRFGVVTDNSGLYDRLTVFDNLKLYCDLYDQPYQKINDVLNVVNLLEETNKKVANLSKGMKQRVTLARALIHEPELLFLDEPTSALDPVNTLHIYRGLRELNAKGTTILLTTHDMNEAETLCDRLAFLHEGKIKLLDTPAKLKKLYSDGTVTVTLKNEEKVVLPTGSEGADTLYELMKRDQVEHIKMNEATIGDIFVKVTGRNLV